MVYRFFLISGVTSNFSVYTWPWFRGVVIIPEFRSRKHGGKGRRKSLSLESLQVYTCLERWIVLQNKTSNWKNGEFTCGKKNTHQWDMPSKSSSYGKDYYSSPYMSATWGLPHLQPDGLPVVSKTAAETSRFATVDQGSLWRNPTGLVPLPLR